MINYSIWCFCSLFHFFHSNVPDNKCHRQKWHVLFFTCIKLVACVLACACAITHIKWRRLYILSLSEKSSKQFLQTFITQVIPNNAFKLFQIILSIYYQRNHSKQFLKTIIREIIQTILTNYYQRNHSKQFLQTITKEIIANNSYKRLSRK